MDRRGVADSRSAAEVRPLETVPISGTLGFPHLQLVCTDHEGHGLVGGSSTPRGQSADLFLGLFESTLADEPPGRFGGKVKDDEKRDGPYALNRKGDLVGPLESVSEVRLSE
jgi:hypothetical protein